MSGSSEDDDYSKFKDVVDNSFVNPKNKEKEKLKSERYIEESTHYNDVKVPAEMQRRIGAQMSTVIEKNVKFVEVPLVKNKKQKVKGGIKLFNTSSDFLSCEEATDIETHKHNTISKNYKIKKRCLENEDLEKDKVAACAISGDYILSKDETKSWKSRRKEKIFKYKTSQNKNCLVSLD